MRSGFLWGLATLLFMMAPTFAGELSFSDGQTHWKSTQCVMPTFNPTGITPETVANDLNLGVSRYNAYVNAAEAYMQCISLESQADANSTSKAIIKAGQDAINETQDTVKKIGALPQH